ncbi:MAG: ANTAR domain-containing protein [Pseudonocardia sp.]
MVDADAALPASAVRLPTDLRSPYAPSPALTLSDTNAAFDRLRRYARNHNLRLSDVARQVVETDLAADVLTRHAAARSAPRRR